MGFIGALALGAGLAFGLGGKDTAGEIVRTWREQGRSAVPKLEKTAEEAANDTADIQHQMHVPSGRSG